MGTKAKIMLFSSMLFSVSSGPMRYRQRIRLAVRPQQVSRHRHPREPHDIAHQDTGNQRQSAPHQRIFHRAGEMFSSLRRR